MPHRDPSEEQKKSHGSKRLRDVLVRWFCLTMLRKLPGHMLLPILFAAPINALHVDVPQHRFGQRAVGMWINISPPSVTVDASAYGGRNYGFHSISVDPKSGSVYVGTCYQGLWRSPDQGKTWSKVNTGANGSMLDTGRLWTIAIDPVNPQVIYTTAGYGSGGILKSTDGGVSWTNMTLPNSPLETAINDEDFYSIAIDPQNQNHIIASFHGAFTGPLMNSPAIIESLDGGNTWVVHPVGKLFYPQYVYFLNNSSTWLLGTTGQGFWRTTNSGQGWSQVSKANFTDGGSQAYRAVNGVWYLAALGSLLRSTNGGRTWKGVGPEGAPYMGITGDGFHMYLQQAIAGGDASARQHYFTSSETDGTQWKQYNGQVFRDGPVHMTFDPARNIVYSANWTAGVWKLQGKSSHSQKTAGT